MSRGGQSLSLESLLEVGIGDLWREQRDSLKMDIWGGNEDLVEVVKANG